MTYTVRELIERIDGRVEKLERSAARQATVRLAVGLASIGPLVSSLATWWLTRH